MGVAPEHLVGILLCRAGAHRLAFAAGDVVAVESWTEGDAFPHARQAFSLPGGQGRVLISATGDAVGVDAIEVFQEAVRLMAPPVLLVARFGGSLEGFISVNQSLWPVMRLSEFCRFLSSEKGASA
jgi:hypothetical protein